MNPTTTSNIIDFMKQHYGKQLQGILLFGSQANGSATEGSDVDLGILLDGAANPETLWDNAQDLACQLKKDVDLIDLRAATTVLQKEAIFHGYWLWQENTLVCDEFEVQVMAMYQQLQYDRREILDDIQTRIKHG